MYALMSAINEKTEKTLQLLKGVHDIMAQLIPQRDSASTSPATHVKRQYESTDAIIDLSNEWTASIDKPRVDAILKELKNGRSAVYVS